MNATPTPDLTAVNWRISYKTSSLRPDGQPVDILHDFYIPALSRSVAYDRVAGYFRSSSLAAASQGFSAFVAQQGRARFIVGADLKPADVAAILTGDEARLTTRLCEQAFADADHWPAAVQQGVELLAWMVARGYLEVRVAFRVHRRHATPLPFSAVEDGYVHEKWALFTDAAGHRLYVAGSLNESHTALVVNAENIDVHCDWRNPDNRQRAEEAAHDFAVMWDDQHPAVRVLPLPEAVRQRLLTFCPQTPRPLEIDGSSAQPEPAAHPTALDWLRFALIKDGPHLPQGRWVGLATVPIEPWPHQQVVARRIVERWPASQMLCDEVGLGKTIEAGLAIRSLVLCGLAQRVLIAAPASLTRQWQRELADKFYLRFARARTGSAICHDYVLPPEEPVAADSLYAPPLLILSTGLLSRPERLRGLPDYDLTLVDEAHYARRRNPTRGVRTKPDYGQLYKAIRDELRPHSRCLLLATATPMQLDPVEVADLLALLPRVGPFQHDGSLLLAYYERLGNLVHEQALTDEDWAFLHGCIKSLMTLDPPLWAYLITVCPQSRVVNRWLERGQPPHRSDLRYLRRLLFAAAPLSRVMLRHTRPLLNIYRREGQLKANLAERHIEPVPRIAFTEQEERVYRTLEDYCRGLSDRIPQNMSDNVQRAAVGFYLSFLRLRFASSLYAIRETLRRRLERVEGTLRYLIRDSRDSLDMDAEELLSESAEDDALAVEMVLKNRTPDDLRWEQAQVQTLLADLDDLSGGSSKTHYLLTVLDKRRDRSSGRIRQTVVFTRFADTLRDLVRRLCEVQPDLRLGTYSGAGGQMMSPTSRQLVSVERDEVKHAFRRGEVDVLLCTDAAAEGLNLQTADLLVNFDLPWNPTKVEQRIGRIDRIGQTHAAIYVLNLCYLNSLEEQVYGRLYRRLQDIGAIVGSQPLSLLPVTQEDFQELAEGKLNAETLETRALERAAAASNRSAQMEISAEDLFKMYTAASQQVQNPAPVTLAAIGHALAESAYLRALGSQWQRTADGEDWLRLTGVPGLPDNVALTVMPSLLERGLPLQGISLHFATYGDPVFDALLRHIVTEHPAPACVRRLAVMLPETRLTVVGYAVCVRQADGQVQTVLVDDYRQVRELTLAEDSTPDAATLADLTAELTRRAQPVSRAVLESVQVETLNERIGRQQILLNRLVIHELLRQRRRIGQGRALFREESEAIERAYLDSTYRDYIKINNLPAQIVAALSEEHLPCRIRQSLGDYVIEAPPVLIRTALDAAWQAANDSRSRQVQTDEVIERLERLLAEA